MIHLKPIFLALIFLTTQNIQAQPLDKVIFFAFDVEHSGGKFTTLLDDSLPYPSKKIKYARKTNGDSAMVPFIFYKLGNCEISRNKPCYLYTYLAGYHVPKKLELIHKTDTMKIILTGLPVSYSLVIPKIKFQKGIFRLTIQEQITEGYKRLGEAIVVKKMVLEKMQQ